MLAQTPLCPRCGYDQTGLADTWQVQCPMLGTCSECGLGFEWVDVWRPDRENVPGLFEHATRVNHFLGWPFWTLWLVARPWSFWARVKLAMRPRIGRLALWPIVTTLTVVIAGSVIATAFAWARWNTSPFWPVAGVRYTPGVTFLGDELVSAWTRPFYSLHSWPSFRALPPSSSWITERNGWRGALLVLFAAWVMWPLMFMVLGDTMRIAKVRWEHVFRATCYALAFLPALGVLRLVMMVTGTPRWGDGVVALAAAALVAWLQTWWFFAIRRGFQLPAAPGVWALLSLASLLAAAVAWALIAAYRRGWM